MYLCLKYMLDWINHPHIHYENAQVEKCNLYIAQIEQSRQQKKAAAAAANVLHQFRIAS